MENLKIETEIREETGKNVSRKLRAAGRIPATLYGQKEEPLNLTVEDSAFRAMLHSRPESAIIDLAIKGKTDVPVNVIVRDVQRHPASGKFLHVDFQRIKLDEKIRVEAHVTLVGDPRGVKEQGGVLDHGTRTLNIMCLPSAIPESIEIDVTGLKIGDSIRLKTLIDLYTDIDFLDDHDTTLANVIPPVVEAKEPVEGAEGAEEAAEPEVIAKQPEKGESGEGDSG